MIQPVSETVVTRTWLENAIRVYEDEQSVVLINMRFDRDKFGAYQAYVTAEVGIAYISDDRKLDFRISNSDCRIRIEKLVFLDSNLGFTFGTSEYPFSYRLENLKKSNLLNGLFEMLPTLKQSLKLIQRTKMFI